MRFIDKKPDKVSFLLVSPNILLYWEALHHGRDISSQKVVKLSSQNSMCRCLGVGPGEDKCRSAHTFSGELLWKIPEHVTGCFFWTLTRLTIPMLYPQNVSVGAWKSLQNWTTRLIARICSSGYRRFTFTNVHSLVDEVSSGFY